MEARRWCAIEGGNSFIGQTFLGDVLVWLVLLFLILPKQNAPSVDFDFIAFSHFPLNMFLYVYTGNQS
jgi:hypothetical protein